jgi:predicted secreted protein
MPVHRRSALRAASLAALLIAAPAAARAETPPGEHDAGATVLRLSETAERQLRRDQLRFELRVEATASEPARLQAEVNRRMAAAFERAKALPSVKLETGGYALYEERPQNAPPRWRGSQSLALVGREFGPLLQLAGELQGDGLAASGMSFRLSREAARGAEDELADEALKRLRERAERIAAGLGLAVLRIRDLHVGNADGARPPPPMPMRAMAAAAAPPPPVAEAGEATVQVTAEAEILLGPTEANRP